jgi:hypothetical protein
VSEHAEYADSKTAAVGAVVMLLILFGTCLVFTLGKD